MNRVQFEASQIMISEAQSNDIYMSVLMRMFSTRANRNGYAVTEAFMDGIVANASKYTCLPQCADAKQLRSGHTHKLTHMLDDQGFQSEQIGSFFSFAKAQDEFGTSLIGEARIPKRDARLCETIRQMYAAGQLAFSFEIMASVISEANGAMLIDAAEGNELIGMAIVSVPAYPEATALKLVAEDEHKEDEIMDETMKKLAEAEARLKLAEEKVQDDEEALKKKDEELSTAKKKCEEVEASLASAQEQAVEKDARITELEVQIAELSPFKAEVETLKAEKAAVELAARQKELTAFAEAQGLDAKAEAVAAAIQAVNYEALIAEAMKQNKKPEGKPTVASYAMTGGMPMAGEYGDLLGKA